ncbi:PEP-CTERM sorting domain-containing protein [Pseudoduganella chitinolytica]|uniref:PEP-CTERM sorting domain-containing protein n=1 Tax=Pseudoduganella chitinolytica TaxID=34070 RepID=A0ABY8B9H7_9BURK|nr:PEP-CTERM sorting domain-containing protein [Pseudoduganella chitinolytica]WEF31014.1 PEP-CTERM sorting domain-containing protein [Pseudoduganella chitinolytica]
MKAVLQAAVLGALALAASAQAEVHTYEYTAVVASINEFELATGRHEWLNVSTLPGFAIALGDTVRGRFSIDTNTGLSYSEPFGDGVIADYSDFTNRNRVSIAFDRSGHDFAALGPLYTNLSITDQPVDSGDDVLHLSQGTYGPGPRESIAIDLTDPSGTALSKAVIPASIAAFGLQTFMYHYDTGVGPGYTQVIVNGGFTSLREVSAVPEPGSYAMLLAGLGLLGWQRRRKG